MDPYLHEMTLASLPALIQAPNVTEDYFRLVYSVIKAVLSLPPDPILDIHNRLFAHDTNTYTGRDLFSELATQRCQFYELTGETPETLLDLVTLLDVHVEREHMLDVRNRVLLMMIWIRSYPRYNMLSIMLHVSKNTIKDEIKDLILVFERKLHSTYITWPSIAEWQEQIGVWEKISVAVGAIDGTSHEIYRPMIEPQEQYCSGHRHYHAIHTQIVVDTQGVVRYVESGFLGHQNDAQQFMLMKHIGRELPFPNDCFLLGDKIYPNRHPIRKPYTTTQLNRKQGQFRQKCLKLNRYVREYRVRVEHAISEL